MKNKGIFPTNFPICTISSNGFVSISNAADDRFQGQWLEKENEARSLMQFGGAVVVYHATVCSADISSNISLLPATAIGTEKLQALGTINYFGKEKSSGQTNNGEELSLPSPGTGWRTASKSWEGVEKHTCKGVITCKEGRNYVLLLTEILNTEENDRETTDMKCFATEHLTFSLLYYGERVLWPL